MQYEDAIKETSAEAIIAVNRHHRKKFGELLEALKPIVEQMEDEASCADCCPPPRRLVRLIREAEEVEGL